MTNTSSYKKGARLGQHFLTSRSATEILAKAAGIQPGDTVLEIGPGKGFLTRTLLAQGATVIAVEKDPALVTILSETFPEDIATGRLSVFHADIRNVSPESLGLSPGSYVLAANIPYYITGEIIRTFLTTSAHPRAMALLIQKEVAERIARSKKESLLSLSVKVYGVPTYVHTVRAGSFNPPPKVDSAILAISNISKRAFVSCSEEAFFATLHAGFASKRKMLAGNLSKMFPKDTVFEAFSHCHVDEKTRAEDVTLETWQCLATQLHREK